MSDHKFTGIIDTSVRNNLIFLVAVLPWITSPSLVSPEMDAKFTVLALVSVLIFFLVSVKILFSSEITVVRTQLDKAILVFLGVVILSASVSGNTHTFFGWDRHREGVFAFFTYAILFFATVNFIKDERSLKILLSAFLLSLGVSNYQGFYQLFFTGSDYGNRVAAGFVDPNTFSGYLLLMIPLAVASIFYLKTSASRIVAALLAASSCFLLIFTFTRIAYVSALLATALFIIFLASQKRYRTITLLLFLTLAVLSVALVMNYFLPQQTIKFFAQRVSLSAFQQGWQNRLGLWKLAWDFAFDRPLFGYGPGSYRFSTGNAGGYGGAHSEYLYYIVTIGWLGFFSFVSILILYFRSALRLLLVSGKYAYLVAGIFLGIIGYLVYISSTYNLPYIASLFWIFLGLTMVAQGLESGPKTRTLTLNIPRLARFFLLVFSLFLFLFLWAEIARLPISSIYWRRAVDCHEKGDIDKALTNYTTASFLVPDSEVYLRASARLALDSAYYENRIDNLPIAIKNCERVITELNKGDGEVWFDLGEAYRLAGFKTKARNSYTKALEFGAPVEVVEESLRALESEP